MKRGAYFFRIGAFSLINDAVERGLRAEFPDLAWRVVDVERDIVRGSAGLLLRAHVEAAFRYGPRIVAQRQPPRDFFPRLNVVGRAIHQWVEREVDPARTALVFQTQSLFDARREGVPHFLYSDHTYLANRRYAQPRPLLPVPRGWLEMERTLYRRATVNFVSSEFAAASVREDYAVPAERVECVFSGQNVPLSASSASRNPAAILFVGVDWERKGGPELLAAFRAVRAARPEAELWIVGCSPAIHEPGVRVVGRVAPERVADFYREAAVFCLPSRMDPSASVIGEAALHGLPVVATPVGGNAERVRDGETGFLRAPESLAPALLELLADGTRREQMGAAAREFASARFTWDAVCRRMADRIRAELSA